MNRMMIIKKSVDESELKLLKIKLDNVVRKINALYSLSEEVKNTASLSKLYEFEARFANLPVTYNVFQQCQSKMYRLLVAFHHESKLSEHRLISKDVDEKYFNIISTYFKFSPMKQILGSEKLISKIDKKAGWDIEVSVGEKGKLFWHRFPGGAQIKEYFDNTTLHGFKYLSEPGRLLRERFFMVAVLLFVFICCIISVYDQLSQYINAPVLVSLDSTPTPVWNIPFPAVTICSENQVRPSYFNINAFIKRNATFDPKKPQSQAYSYMTMYCESTPDGEIEYFSKYILDDIHTNIWDQCKYTFAGVAWKFDVLENPCRGPIIQPSLTFLGACYTFNSMPAEYLYRPSAYLFNASLRNREPNSEEDSVWTPDGGYVGDEDFWSPPWRLAGGDRRLVAEFVLYFGILDFESKCFFGSNGFTVYIHSPADIPSYYHPSVYVPTDHKTNIKVIPELMVTDKTLHQWSPNQRGCFHQDERPLLYFRYYTEKNCDLECESNVTLAICGCVQFYHPRSKNTPVCGPLKYDCFANITTSTLNSDLPVARACNCKPACSEYEYKMSVSHMRKNYATGRIAGKNIATIYIQFKTQKVTAISRRAVFSFSDFIANIGGLLGLFLGFTIVSLFEILYFCTLRYRKKRTRKIRDLSKA